MGGWSLTYSIVAIDPRRRFVGVATASGSVAVGSRVPWARYGVGAVATQAYTNPALGPLILELLESGLGAEEALERALVSDSGRDFRQVGVVAFDGSKAVFCGRLIPREFGCFVGRFCVCIANLVRDGGVAEAMCRVFDEVVESVEFHEALLRALEEGSRLGGDARGDRSAAIVVCGATGYGRYFDRVIDARVDYSPNPVQELRKVVEALVSRG